MAPPRNESDADWALRQFLEMTVNAIEELDKSIDKISDTVIETKILHESTIQTLLKLLGMTLGGVLLLAGIKVIEIVGILP